MQSINIRNLFIIACVLKVASALMGWYFGAPWTLGFALPLLVMVVYMWLGATRRNDDVSDEKFADSCYYLGFIFTIASISVALMDLPNIGTHIQDIAVRFGAAMLSTVLGLSVRVAMVTFRKDLGDAIQNAEEGVVEASIRFRDQLGAALDRLNSFESAVDQASRLSVERVNLQVESLSKNHADRLAEFFTELTAGNQAAFTSALAEVKSASNQLSGSVDGYAKGMRANLGSIEAKVSAFSDAITNRLQTTVFPDDYFAKHLEYPLGQFKSAADDMHERISGVSESISESTESLSLALKKLRDRASRTETALESVSNLAIQQKLMLDGAQGMMNRLEGVGDTLKGLDEAFGKTVQTFENSKAIDIELKEAIQRVAADSEAMRAEVRDQLAKVVQQLISASEGQDQNFGQASATIKAAALNYAVIVQRLESLSEISAIKLQESASANLKAADSLTASTAATKLTAEKLEGIAVNDIKIVDAVSKLEEKSNIKLQNIDTVIQQLSTIASQLSEINYSTRAEANIKNSARELSLVSSKPLDNELSLAPKLITPTNTSEVAVISPTDSTLYDSLVDNKSNINSTPIFNEVSVKTGETSIHNSNVSAQA